MSLTRADAVDEKIVRKRAIEQLNVLGYPVATDGSDDKTLQFAIDSMDIYIRMFCHLDYIPAALETVYVDLVCGKFLKRKNGIADTVDVTQIRLGDTSVSVTDPVMEVVKLLMDHRAELIRWRRVAW